MLEDKCIVFFHTEECVLGEWSGGEQEESRPLATDRILRISQSSLRMWPVNLQEEMLQVSVECANCTDSANVKQRKSE